MLSFCFVLCGELFSLKNLPFSNEIIQIYCNPNIYNSPQNTTRTTTRITTTSESLPKDINFCKKNLDEEKWTGDFVFFCVVLCVKLMGINSSRPCFPSEQINKKSQSPPEEVPIKRRNQINNRTEQKKLLILF